VIAQVLLKLRIRKGGDPRMEGIGHCSLYDVSRRSCEGETQHMQPLFSRRRDMAVFVGEERNEGASHAGTRARQPAHQW
jgi:hypothetical protein